jgi:ketosteroid isomerase-like protein
MTRLALPLVALALLAAPAVHSATPSFTAEMEAVEQARFATWVKGDIAAIQAVMADDVLYCHSNTQCQTKQEFIADIQSKNRVYTKMHLLSMTAKPLGSEGAVVNGKVEVGAESPGKKVAFTGIYTAVYVKRGGRWQLISWQSTTLP